jgi:hypothetical protein
MQVVEKNISIEELKKMAAHNKSAYLVKAVFDVQKEIMVVDLEMHADGECSLMEEYGSAVDNLWGVVIHPDQCGKSRIEFNAMINMRPSWGNRSRFIEVQETREKIKVIANKLISK